MKLAGKQDSNNWWHLISCNIHQMACVFHSDHFRQLFWIFSYKIIANQQRNGLVYKKTWWHWPVENAWAFTATVASGKCEKNWDGCLYNDSVPHQYGRWVWRKFHWAGCYSFRRRILLYSGTVTLSSATCWDNIAYLIAIVQLGEKSQLIKATLHTFQLQVNCQLSPFLHLDI